MRGDSRRDMYAKAVALCGLGALAGAGALVDYWPVGVRYPFASAPAGAVVVAQPQTAAQSVRPDLLAELDDVLARAAAAHQPVPVPVPVDVPQVARQTAEPTRPDLYASLPVVAAGYDFGTTLDVESLPEPEFVTARYELPVVEAAPSALLGSGSARYLPSPSVRPVPALDDDDGFLSSAFRKTGSSIVRTGVKTGSSVVGAVRVVGSVVRRAWPN